MNTRAAAGACSCLLDLLFRDGDDDDNYRWKRMVFGGTPAVFQPVIDGTGLIEMRVDMVLTYPRIFTITGSPTKIILIAKPGATLSAGRGLFPG